MVGTIIGIAFAVVFVAFVGSFFAATLSDLTLAKLPGRKRAKSGKTPRFWHRYAVIWDARPFGFRVESVHTFKTVARLIALIGNRGYRAERLQYVLDENESMKDPDVFRGMIRALSGFSDQERRWIRETSQSL